MIFISYSNFKKRHAKAVARLHALARVLPLVTAIIAPLSTLLDIPAVTQRWYAYYGGN
jgi:potassium channel subfamily K, other eukaryote